MIGQSRLHSIFESFVNVLVGYLVAILSQITIFPLFGIYLSLGENLEISAWFTAISLVRSFVLRRVFNRWMLRKTS